MTTRTARRLATTHDTTQATRTMTLTIDAAELRRLTLAAADGFRLSTAYATLDESAPDASAILERAGLLAFAKSLKPMDAPVVTITTGRDAWTFAAANSGAAVRLIDGTYPDFRALVGSGDEPVLFSINPAYFRDTIASHGSEPVHVSRATDEAHAPLFFTAGDGTRHVVMPMVVGSDASGTWRRREDAAAVEVAVEVEPERAMV
jgi:DNA polymerase III sliding clamp (beta) subunit (PCNA family)